MIHPDQQFLAQAMRLEELREEARLSRLAARPPGRPNAEAPSPRWRPGALLATLLARLARRSRRGEQPP